MLKKNNSGYQTAFICRLDLLHKRKMSDFHYARSYTLWTSLNVWWKNFSYQVKNVQCDTVSKKRDSIPLSGEGNGNPLQCSCLENPRDVGAWWAAVCGAAQSQTRLKHLSSSSSIRLRMAIIERVRIINAGEGLEKTKPHTQLGGDVS